MPNSNTRDAQFQTTRMFAVVNFILAPCIYLYMVFGGLIPPTEPKPLSMLLYGLLAYAFLQLAVTPLIVRMFVRNKSRGNEPNRVQVIWICKIAMVEAVFLCGLVYWFVTKDPTPVSLFYGLGVIGVLMHWPTRERFDAIADQLEAT